MARSRSKPQTKPQPRRSRSRSRSRSRAKKTSTQQPSNGGWTAGPMAAMQQQEPKSTPTPIPKQQSVPQQIQSKKSGWNAGPMQASTRLQERQKASRSRNTTQKTHKITVSRPQPQGSPQGKKSGWSAGPMAAMNKPKTRPAPVPTTPQGWGAGPMQRARTRTNIPNQVPDMISELGPQSKNVQRPDGFIAPPLPSNTIYDFVDKKETVTPSATQPIKKEPTPTTGWIGPMAAAFPKEKGGWIGPMSGSKELTNKTREFREYKDSLKLTNAEQERYVEKMLADTGFSETDWSEIAGVNREIDSLISEIKLERAPIYNVGDESLSYADTLKYLQDEKQRINDESKVTVGNKDYFPTKQSFANFTQDYFNNFKKAVILDKPAQYKFVDNDTYFNVVIRKEMGDISNEEATSQLTHMNNLGMQLAPKKDVIKWGKTYLDFDSETPGQQSFTDLQKSDPAATLQYQNKEFGLGYDYAKGYDVLEDQTHKLMQGKYGPGVQRGTGLDTFQVRAYGGLPALYETAGYGYRALTGVEQKPLKEQMEAKYQEGAYRAAQARHKSASGDTLGYWKGAVTSPVATDVLLPALTGGAFKIVSPIIGGAFAGSTKLARVGAIAARAPRLSKYGMYAAGGSLMAAPVVKTGLEERAGIVEPGSTASSMARMGTQLASFGLGYKAGSKYVARKGDSLRTSGEQIGTKSTQSITKIKGKIAKELPKVTRARAQFKSKVELMKQTKFETQAMKRASADFYSGKPVSPGSKGPSIRIGAERRLRNFWDKADDVYYATKGRLKGSPRKIGKYEVRTVKKHRAPADYLETKKHDIHLIDQGVRRATPPTKYVKGKPLKNYDAIVNGKKVNFGK